MRETGGRIRVRSGLNPMLWLCAIITMPSLVVYGLKDDPSDWLLVFAFAPEATAIFGFLFFLLFDRPYLQSEQFQIRKMEIEMIEEKGRPSIEASQVDELTIKSAVLPALSGQVEDE
ncbi:MAG TPA: hypothetical protein VJR02_06730 [Pyrinomonadaceae bacterium]|nr:hypothetical protein [Pyrinomonadaceae bacterium]